MENEGGNSKKRKDKETDKNEKDMEDLMEEIDRDPEIRKKINLYKVIYKYIFIG